MRTTLIGRKGKSGQDCKSRNKKKKREQRTGSCSRSDVLTECCLSPAHHPPCLPCVLRQALQRRQTNHWSLVHPHPSPSLHLSVSLQPRHRKRDALQCCSLRRPLPAAVLLSQTGASRPERLHHPALTGGETRPGCSAIV